jgi:hypothetical protein
VIPELERYHGIVLRQLLVAAGGPRRLGVADLNGRIDAYCFENAAFQVKYSTKRLSPWQFTYLTEHIDEIAQLQSRFPCVWVMLVCGGDGVVAVSAEDLKPLLQITNSGSASIRVSRSKNAMYRVCGAIDELARAKPRGVQQFVDEALGQKRGVRTAG